MSKKYLEGTRIEDLTGMKFGKLTVIEFDWDRHNKDKIRKDNGEIKSIRYCWMCECECGKITSVSGGSLRWLKQASCGMCYTFENWCLDNNHQDYLDLWDYELNECKPSDIGFGVGNKHWFKCSRGIHESESWLISSLTSKKSNGNANATVSCRKCNSFGQYLLDTYGNLDMWSDKNTADPFEIAKMDNKKYYLKCNACGEIKHMCLSNFMNYGISCRRCGDGISVPEKMFKEVLDQSKIKYKTQLTKSDFDWIGKYRYDFYIPSLNLIVETHGRQHYDNAFDSAGGRCLEEERCNDKLKKELAIQNGFNYCVIDCRYSELEWLKDNIIKEFGKYVILSNVDWTKSYIHTQKSLVKEVCDYWENRQCNETTSDVAIVFGLNKGTTIRYLKRGNNIGLCTYDAKEEMRKNNSINGKNNGKQVEIFKDGLYVETFESVAELERQSEELFGVKLLNSSVSLACLGKRKQYKGFTFRYL